MALNKNNFLRFNGSFTKRSYTFDGNIAGFEFYANLDSIIVQPVVFLNSSIGLDLNTFKITSIQGTESSGGYNPITLTQDCEYDGNGNLTVFRPIDPTDVIVGIRIFFTIQDYSGNYAPNGHNIGYVQINMDAIVVAWVVYPLSQTCILDLYGNNTGYSNFSQLKLVNSLTGSDISPLQLKGNYPSDPDYIAPVTDYVTCPNVAATYSPLFISNYTQNGADTNPNDIITITNLYLYSATGGIGSTPITLNIPCNIPNQVTYRFNVPAIAWDTVSILYTVQAGGNMATATPSRYWKSQVNGVIQGFGPTGVGISDNLVDNSGILSGSSILTVPPNPSGITIFAQ